MNNNILIIGDLWRFIEKKHKAYFVLLLIVMMLTSAVEVISIGSVIPVVGIFTSDDGYHKYMLALEKILHIKNFSKDDSKFFLIIIFCIAAFISGALRMILLKMNSSVAFMIGADLGNKIYTHTLHQPYLVHISRSSSEIITGIQQKASGVTHNAIAPCINIISATILMLFIITAIFMISPLITIYLILITGFIYLFVAVATSSKLKTNSRIISSELNSTLKALQEGLGGIRDILIDGSQNFYSKKYQQASQRLLKAQASNLFISSSPRYVIEVIGMIVVGVLAFQIADEARNSQLTIPMLGAIAFGIQKLLPLGQQIYSAFSSFKGSEASLSDALALLNQPLPQHSIGNRGKVIRLVKEISFQNIDFQYSETQTLALKKINLTINKGDRLGIIGRTGSGKSTLTDILMALLTPTNGRILVDNQVITPSNAYQWQKNIAHVPQNIYFSDLTIAENIAIGMSAVEMNQDRIRSVIRSAQLDEVIDSLPLGVNTIIGERGVRLSGGQRQRIGIARALYKNVDLLILDEATNALDVITEQNVIDSISKLNPEITIVIITHRDSTLKICNKVLELHQGEIANIKGISI